MNKFLFVLIIGFSAVSMASDVKEDTSQLDQVSNQFQAGIHYEIINPAWDTQSDKPVVFEFFSYMCPGCNAFEPVMKKIEKEVEEEATVIRVPVPLFPQWEPHAKAYYAFETMEILPKVHDSFFAAIHQYKKQFRTIEDIAEWVSSVHGVDEQKFLSTIQSFAVDTKFRKAKQMIKAMSIGRIPALVFDGKFKPSFDQLKTQEDIITIAKHLVHQSVQ